MDSRHEADSRRRPRWPQRAARCRRSRLRRRSELDEVVKLVKIELISGRAAHNERGTGFNPYDQGLRQRRLGQAAPRLTRTAAQGQ